MRKLTLGLLLACAATATPAFARDGQVYLGVDGGIVIPEDFNFSGNVDGDYSTGLDVDALIGYDFGMFRVEGEAGYKETDADVSVGNFSADGNVSIVSGMVNGLVELGDEGISAFGGGGIGYGKVSVDAPGPGFDDDSAGGFAWQLIAGLRVGITENLDASIKFRYFKIHDLEFTDNFGDPIGGSLRTESLLAGLTYNFGAKRAAPMPPAPPPPPPPPLLPPRAVPAPPAPPPPSCNKGPYIVFFDWDKDTITPEAAQTLDSAISAYGMCRNVPVMLAGYTDRSGSDRYNVALSQRRNSSVTAYMTRNGVPRAAITGQGFGESNPRVPTADGVRELQNRRVEISYGPGSGN